MDAEKKVADTIEDQVVSYMELRKIIGIIGLFFPFIMMIGGFISTESFTIQPSISDYYYTGMRNFLVGFMVALALFLYTYRYGNLDNIAGNLAGLFAAGVAFFPTSEIPGLVSTIHFVSAGLLFLTLSYFSLFIFTLTDENIPSTPEKLFRNKIYRICGFVMLAVLLILLIYFIAGFDWQAFSFVFWMETIAFVSFGFSWLVKGGMFFKDKISDEKQLT